MAEKRVEICNHCGRSVAWGSGFFVNRVPDLNDVYTRIMNHLNFPEGDFVCWECDEKTSDDYYPDLWGDFQCREFDERTITNFDPTQWQITYPKK